jgi:hypothetical protein
MQEIGGERFGSSGGQKEKQFYRPLRSKNNV